MLLGLICFRFSLSPFSARLSRLDSTNQLLLPFLRHCGSLLVGSRKMRRGNRFCSTENLDALVTKPSLTPRRNTRLPFFALYLANHGGGLAVVARQAFSTLNQSATEPKQGVISSQHDVCDEVVVDFRILCFCAVTRKESGQDLGL